jgi:hypothetical protein
MGTSNDCQEVIPAVGVSRVGSENRRDGPWSVSGQALGWRNRLSLGILENGRRFAAAAVPVLLCPGCARVHADAAQLGSLAQAALELGEAGEAGQAGDVVPEPDGVLRGREAADHRAEEGSASRGTEPLGLLVGAVTVAAQAKPPFVRDNSKRISIERTVAFAIAVTLPGHADRRQPRREDSGPCREAARSRSAPTGPYKSAVRHLM